MSSTAIEWRDATWNPTVGCDRISPGCANCYAKTLHDKRHAALLAGKKMAPQYARPFETLQMIDARLVAPLHWRAPRRVFVNSVSDLFHEDVPDAFIDQVFAVMSLAPRHTFQILTKRAKRMRAYITAASEPWGYRRFGIESAMYEFGGDEDARTITNDGWPLPNVWPGVSVENQHFADERISLLLDIPAAVRFISAEPLLADVDLFAFLDTPKRNECLGILGGHKGVPGLDWVIVGGESGYGARPFDVAWARSIVAQCKPAGVPVFVKQLGTVPLVEAARLRHWEWRSIKRPEHKRFTTHADGEWRVHLADGKGGDISEWPEDLRVREFPR